MILKLLTNTLKSSDWFLDLGRSLFVSVFWVVAVAMFMLITNFRIGFCNVCVINIGLDPEWVVLFVF